jgi:aspartyl-tRNA synthetase
MKYGLLCVLERGVGFDRLCMMLLGRENIRDVIPVPAVEAEISHHHADFRDKNHKLLGGSRF